MSYIVDQDEDQDQSQIDENAQGGTQVAQSLSKKSGNEADSSAQLSGSSGVAGPGGGGGASVASGAQSGAGKPSSSGSWVNLQNYIDANAEQAPELGRKVAEGVTGDVAKAKGDVSGASSDFLNQVQANTVSQDQGAIDRAISEALSARAGQSLSPESASAFQKQANAAYAGPTDFTSSDKYTQAQKSIQKAQKSVENTKSEAGRQTLLEDRFKGASPYGYSQGEKNLDQLLLERAPENKTVFQGIQSDFSGLSDALSDAATKGNAAAQQAMQTDRATSAAAKAALERASSGFESGVRSGAEKAKSTYDSENARVLNDIGKKQLFDDELSLLGLRTGEKTYGLSGNALKSYINPGTAPTLYNSATADQYAQAAALAQLSGGQSFLPSQYAQQAGSSGNPYSFDLGRFQNDVSGAKAQLDQEAVNAVRDWANRRSDYATGASANTPEKAYDVLRSHVPSPGNPNGLGMDTKNFTPQEYERWSNILASLEDSIQGGGSLLPTSKPYSRR